MTVSIDYRAESSVPSTFSCYEALPKCVLSIDVSIDYRVQMSVTGTTMCYEALRKCVLCMYLSIIEHSRVSLVQLCAMNC